MTTSPEPDAGPTGSVESRPALEARRLYRFFRTGPEETLALQGISLAVMPAGILAVSGPSGSGKSTLLNCLAGLDEPAGGMVWVGGEQLSHQSERTRSQIRARRIGVVRQNDNLIPHLNLVANVRFAQLGRYGGRHHRDTSPDPADLLERVGLGHRSLAFPSELSGGERARAGIAVALSNDPDVVLADEPTGELDGHTETQVLRLLGDLAGRGAALILVTHSQAVAALADRHIVLKDGEIVS